MYPHDVRILGLTTSVWNALFLLAVFVGYFVFRATAASLLADNSRMGEQNEIHAGVPRVRFLALRYWLVVYLSAVAAQLFAYAFDVNTTLAPPPEVSALTYYFDPLAGPKTLYGVIVFLPLSAWLAMLGAKVPLARTLDLFTPAMLVVLCIARLGCLLQGCCYGAANDLLGVSFPANSPVFAQQVGEGILAASAERSLPVVPTQGLEAGFLAVAALWAWRRRADSPPLALFLPAVASYSVFRFAIEFFRADAGRGIYGPLATSQWIALLVLAVVGAALWAPRLGPLRQRHDPA